MADNDLSNKYGKIYDDMLKGLKEYIEKKIDESNFDKTYIGTIMGEGSVKGLKVLINDVTYDNVDSATFLYNPNSIVRVLVPQNDFKRAYVLGTTKINADEINNFEKAYFNGYQTTINGETKQVYSAKDLSTVYDDYYNGYRVKIDDNNPYSIIQVPSVGEIAVNLGKQATVIERQVTVSSNTTNYGNYAIDLILYNSLNPPMAFEYAPFAFCQIIADGEHFNPSYFGISIYNSNKYEIQVMLRNGYTGSSSYTIKYWILLYRPSWFYKNGTRYYKDEA